MAFRYDLNATERKDLLEVLIHRLCELKPNIKTHVKNGGDGIEIVNKEEVCKAIYELTKDLSTNKKISDFSPSVKGFENNFYGSQGIQSNIMDRYMKVIFKDDWNYTAKDKIQFIKEFSEKIKSKEELEQFLKEINHNSALLTGNRIIETTNVTNPNEETKDSLLESYRGFYLSVKTSGNGIIWIYPWKFEVKYENNNAKGKVTRPTHNTGIDKKYEGSYRIQDRKTISILISLETTHLNSSHHYLAELKNYDNQINTEFECIGTSVFEGKPLIENEYFIKISDNPEDYKEIYEEAKYQVFFQSTELERRFPTQANDSDFINRLKTFLKPKKQVEHRICHVKYTHISLDNTPVYKRQIHKFGYDTSNNPKFEPNVLTEYQYTKIIKYGKIEHLPQISLEHTSKDETYTDNAFVEMQMLHPVVGIEQDSDYNANEIKSEVKVNDIKDYQTIITTASYINDNKSESFKNGIRFSRETEMGLLVIDFLSLKNFDTLNIQLKKLEYFKDNSKTAFKTFDVNNQNLNFILTEEIEDEILLTKYENNLENIKGVYRFEVNTNIKKHDHLQVEFNITPKSNF
jgi:hypothetical protein